MDIGCWKRSISPKKLSETFTLYLNTSERFVGFIKRNILYKTTVEKVVGYIFKERSGYRILEAVNFADKVVGNIYIIFEYIRKVCRSY